MTYYQFVQTVEQKVSKEIGERVRVSIHTARKYNGVMRRGLLFSEQDGRVSPTIYLEEYYRRFEQGGAMDAVVAEIVKLYGRLRMEKTWEKRTLHDYAELGERIVYRLVNREKNLEMLREMPYIPYLDLAVIFYVLFESDICGTAAMPVREEHLRQWGVAKEQVCKQARDNTCRLLPCEFKAMSSVMAEFMDTEDMGEKDILFVLTNRSRSFGAAAVLYPGELERIGNFLEEDYYVLPSSVHEMLVVRKSAVLGKEPLSEMVKEINETQVAEEEVLSDRAYYYDRARKELVL